MPTPIKDLLAELARTHAQNPRAARALIRFYRNEIARALADGCSRKEVWSTLLAEKKINFRYATFCRLTREVLSAPRPAPPEPSRTLH